LMNLWGRGTWTMAISGALLILHAGSGV